MMPFISAPFASFSALLLLPCLVSHPEQYPCCSLSESAQPATRRRGLHPPGQDPGNPGRQLGEGADLAQAVLIQYRAKTVETHRWHLPEKL